MTTTAAPRRAPLAVVTSDLAQRGRILTQRRMRHAIRHIQDAAHLAGMDRKTVARAEEGIASVSSVEALEAFYDRLDEEKGIDSTETDAPAEHTDRIEFDVTGPTTAWHVVVRGPMESADEVRDQVEKLLRNVEQRD